MTKKHSSVIIINGIFNLVVIATIVYVVREIKDSDLSMIGIILGWIAWFTFRIHALIVDMSDE